MKIRGKRRWIRQLQTWQKKIEYLPPNLSETDSPYIRIRDSAPRVKANVKIPLPIKIRKEMLKILIAVGEKWHEEAVKRGISCELRLLVFGNSFEYSELILTQKISPFAANSFQNGPFPLKPFPNELAQQQVGRELAWQAKRFVQMESVSHWQERLASLAPSAQKRAQKKVIKRFHHAMLHEDVVEYDAGPAWILPYP